MNLKVGPQAFAAVILRFSVTTHNCSGASGTRGAVAAWWHTRWGATTRWLRSASGGRWTCSRAVAAGKKGRVR